MNNRNRSNSLDWPKRKRNSPEVNDKTQQGDIFKKSKITSRSPEKEDITPKPSILSPPQNKEEMEELKEMMKQIAQDLMSEMKINKDEIKEELRKNSDSIQKLKEEFKVEKTAWEKEKRELKDKIESIEDQLERQERKKRINNIVIKGLRTNTQQITNEIEKFISDNLQVQIKIKEAYKLTGKQNTPIIIVELEDWNDKLLVLRNKYKINMRTIYIHSDLTPQERKIQAAIREKAKDESGKGNKVKVGYKKLIINEIRYDWDKKAADLVKYEDSKN